MGRKMALYPSTHKTLLEKIRSGDEVSWNEFYERYAPVIRHLAAGYGLEPAECDDVLQDVMLKFFRHGLVMRYSPEKSRFRTYFNRIVHSCACDHLRRKQSRSREIVSDELPEVPVPPEKEELFLNEWRAQMLDEALDRLRGRVSAQNFLAFHMTVFQERPAPDVAAFLNMDVRNVYVARSRGTAMLKEIVAKMREEDPELRFDWDARA